MTDTKGSDVQHDNIEVVQEAKAISDKKATSSSSKTTKTSSAAKADGPKKASATKKTTKTSTAKKTTTSKAADAKEGGEKTTLKKSATATSGAAEKKPSATKKATPKKTTAATTKSATAAKKTTKVSAAESKSAPKTASSKASPSLAKGAKEAEGPVASADDKKVAETTKAKAPQKRAASSAKSAASKTTKTATTKSATKTKTASVKTADSKTTGAKTASPKPAEIASSESVGSSPKENKPAVGILEGSKSLPLEGSKAKGLPAGEVHAALASQENKALQEDKKAALAGSSAKPLSGTSKALPAGETDEGEGKTSPAKKKSTVKTPRKTATKTAAKSTKTTKGKEETSATTKATSPARGSESSSVATEALSSQEISEKQDKATASGPTASGPTVSEVTVSGEKPSGEASAVSSAQPTDHVSGNAPDNASGNTSGVTPKADSQDVGEAALEAVPVANEKESGNRGRRPSKKTSPKTTSPKNTKAEAEKQEDSAEGDEQADNRGKTSSKAEAKKNQPTSRTQRRKMFVSVMPEEQIEVVITEEGQVQEYYVEMLQQQKTKGNIYKATIHNVDANLQAAFINYGANKNGFLQIDEVHPEYYNVPHDEKSGRRFPPIQKVLKPGQELLVQVVKEPNASKGAFLTTYLSLAGRFLVLTPGREQIGVSRKVDDGGERGRLREMLEDFKPGPGLGVIVRTVSIGMNKATLKKDLQSLKNTWKKVRALGTEEVAPKLIHEEIGLATRSVRDYLTDQIVEVWLDDPDTAKDVDELVSTLFPKKSKLVHVHTDFSISLFERFNLQRQLDQIQSREVPLPSGGRLVIDTTEALTAIDINSGRSGGKSNFEDTAFRTNMEAAKMIPLQLRLRDIGGQVVCDFIEMRDKSHWREVEKTVRGAMKIDRARHDVGRISSFGLLELVRQRLGSSAISVNMEVCPHCKGSGVRRNMEWQSQQALKDIARKMRAAKEQKQAAISYGVDVGLAMHLLNSKRQRLNHLEEQLGVSVEITLAEQE